MRPNFRLFRALPLFRAFLTILVFILTGDGGCAGCTGATANALLTLNATLHATLLSSLCWLTSLVGPAAGAAARGLLSMISFRKLPHSPFCISGLTYGRSAEDPHSWTIMCRDGALGSWRLTLTMQPVDPRPKNRPQTKKFRPENIQNTMISYKCNSK